MRKIIPINNNWYFKADYEEGYEKVDDLRSFENVNLPHTNIELPYNYFDEKMYQIKSCYKYPLHISEKYRDKVIYIHFEGVMAYAQVYLNGLYIGEHKGGYTPFDIRIDEVYDWKKELNMLTVVVDSTERSDIPPKGGQIDYLTYGGIYREVSLGIYDDVFIKNIKVETHGIYDNEKSLNLIVHLENLNHQSGNVKFKVKINDKNGKEVFYKEFNTYLDAVKDVYSFNIENLKDIKLWDVDNPNLYEIKVGMKINNFSDEYDNKFGFREAVFKPDGFYLNGRKLKLRGLNRHQSYPYVGYAMPRRVQEKDAEILKNELHLNIVRTSHYPQSKHFLNKCDELGLLVFEEIPGWQYIGNSEWKKVAEQNLREMITRDWNHPSIILWGVRINESQDDDAFYKNMNKIAHEIDPTRQTGGVRYITNSSFLEDVYTFNDFIHDGINKPLRKQQEVTGLEHNVPYLVTEYNGHMYPTKRFDNEERQMEHCLRHLRIQNASYLDDSISGAIGWCAFDYNTHKDFGSGDRICYHGVMDMFRLPKFASYVYKSQVSPDIEPILEPVTFWARGERSIGGVIPLIIFTNCDYIELQYGNKTKIDNIYPNRDAYKGIPYPPIIIDYDIVKPEMIGAWGMVWEDLTLKGFYKGNKVIERKFSREPIPTYLYVVPDDTILSATQKDATRIVVKILDQYGNLLPFINEVIKIEIEGPAKLQGPNEVALIGGA
uniref:Beta-galactosidase n=2 Tax=Thermoanaerobacterium thermosulfurigenes TaxID=33950 RepID=BGAL_THETU|nr:RecName: Full=Beta-galactosidase; Short=Beta-gal [Thermoanaerobacterium thermosulfurigenes]AAA23249.1 beta-galactosidase [Thermoanaerobacterium thermosulfurigenes]CAA38462.1 beta-galactosidase [Thermoanaerobacterium thermosulfurigenes]